MYDPIAYTYEGDTHCPDCTLDRFGYGADGFIGSDSVDSEGNPVGAVAPWEEWPHGITCGTCGEVILESEDDNDEDLW